MEETTQNPTEVGTTQDPAPTESAPATQDTPASESTGEQQSTILADFTIPEGVTADQATVGAFKEVATELGMSQEAAQKVIDKLAPFIAGRQAEQLEAYKATILEEAKADKEIGGSKFDASVKQATNFINQYPHRDELKDLLNATGMGNHKAAIRLFAWLDAKTSESKVLVSPDGGVPDATASLSAVERLKAARRAGT